MAVLKLSTMWNFARMREISLTWLHSNLNFDPALKLTVARRFDINEWLVPALNTLAQRTAPLAHRDYELLGPDWTLMLAQVRETYVARCTCPKRTYSFS